MINIDTVWEMNGVQLIVDPETREIYALLKKLYQIHVREAILPKIRQWMSHEDGKNSGSLCSLWRNAMEQ